MLPAPAIAKLMRLLCLKVLSLIVSADSFYWSKYIFKIVGAILANIVRTKKVLDILLN